MAGRPLVRWNYEPGGAAPRTGESRKVDVCSLRCRTIGDVTIEDPLPMVQRSYVRAIAKFICCFGRGPDRWGPEEVRAFRTYLSVSAPMLHLSARRRNSMQRRAGWLSAEMHSTIASKSTEGIVTGVGNSRQNPSTCMKCVRRMGD